MTWTVKRGKKYYLKCASFSCLCKKLDHFFWGYTWDVYSVSLFLTIQVQVIIKTLICSTRVNKINRSHLEALSLICSKVPLSTDLPPPRGAAPYQSMTFDLWSESEHDLWHNNWRIMHNMNFPNFLLRKTYLVIGSKHFIIIVFVLCHSKIVCHCQATVKSLGLCMMQIRSCSTINRSKCVWFMTEYLQN